MCVCACVCVCVRARACVSVRVRVCVYPCTMDIFIMILVNNEDSCYSRAVMFSPV